MTEQPMPNDTQQWLIMAAIVQIVCSTIVTIVGLIVNKKLEDNTELTKQVSKKADVAAEKADEAAGKAEQAAKVGQATLKAAQGSVGKIKEHEKKIEELQGESGLLRRESHIKGENGDKEKP